MASEPKRRRPAPSPRAELLEGRALLTGSAGNTFALMQGTVPTANGTAAVQVTVDRGHFTLPKNKITLGVDIAAPDSSTFQGKIATITGTKVQAAAKGHAAKATKLALTRDGAAAVLAPITLSKTATSGTYTVNLAAQGGTSGQYLLGFYLPGDADGNGQVDHADLAAIKAASGTSTSDSDYNFDADTNRDGVVNQVDLKLAQKNLGAAVTITPVVTANLDSSSDTGAADRVTASNTAKFTGTATPGATITFQNVAQSGPAVASTVDAQGVYTLTVPLSPGANTFEVTTHDAFGQSVSGQISPVTYQQNLPGSS